MTRYIFITGGVVSSLGKGIASATIGTLLQARGFSVKLRKLDPYLNIDPGTMSPTEHGEVFVTDDGTEADMDLGHYERFTGNNETKDDNTTTGKIYEYLLKKERKGDFLGKTIQIIPHVTNVIKEFVTKNTDDVDFMLIEIGGTVGDIEGLPFYEAIRQLGFELGKENACYVHLTYLPYIKMAGELKTKPTQHSVKTLQSLGIQPNILLCRADENIPEKELEKISLFCNVKTARVIPALNASNIYEVPLLYHKCGLDTQIVEYFNLKDKSKFDITKWENIHKTILNYSREVKIAVVGKYVAFKESYKSLIEALSHAGIANNVKVNIVWVDSRNINSKEDLNILKDVKGILVPGGFGKGGTDGKILAIQYARENNIPFLGICLGMQMAVVEFARNVLGLKDAHSTEFVNTANPVINLITEWEKDGKKETRNEQSDLGGTMRLGGYDAKVRKDTLLYKIYNNKDIIRERHRHRYEVNVEYKQKFENAGLIISATSVNGDLPECIELKDHKFFVGVQFHPELTSRPFAVNPLFKAFINSCL